MKAKFIYIGKNDSDRLPKSEFKAVKLTTRELRKLHPQLSDEEIKSTVALYPLDFGYDDSAFVYGVGWKKATEKNTVTVPVFSGEVEDWDRYLSEYGEECLFYSLTGYSLSSNDCCAYRQQTEFNSLRLMEGGITEYQEFATDILRIQEIQKQVLTDKFDWMAKYELESFIKKVSIDPEFRIFIIAVPPYLDTPADDDKLEAVYRKLRMHELTVSHPEYNKMESLRKESESEMAEYHKLKDKIFHYAYDKVCEEIVNGTFPCQMKARMELLYGEELTDLYSRILDKVTEDETEQEEEPCR